MLPGKLHHPLLLEIWRFGWSNISLHFYTTITLIVSGYGHNRVNLDSFWTWTTNSSSVQWKSSKFGNFTAVFKSMLCLQQWLYPYSIFNIKSRELIRCKALNNVNFLICRKSNKATAALDCLYHIFLLYCLKNAILAQLRCYNRL